MVFVGSLLFYAWETRFFRYLHARYVKWIRWIQQLLRWVTRQGPQSVETVSISPGRFERAKIKSCREVIFRALFCLVLFVQILLFAFASVCKATAGSIFLKCIGGSFYDSIFSDAYRYILEVLDHFVPSNKFFLRQFVRTYPLKI